MADIEMSIPEENDKSIDNEPVEVKGKSSFGMAVFNLSNTILGSGILALAFAMSKTGIILFVALMTVMAIFSAYSVHLMLKSADVAGVRTYAQLGYRAYGTGGKLVAICAITFNNIEVLATYLHIVMSHLPLVIDGLLNREDYLQNWFLNGKYLIAIASGCVILPLCLMRWLGYLGYASGFSLMCIVFFVAAVIYKKFATLCTYGVINSTMPVFNSSTCTNTSNNKVKLVTLNPKAAYTIYLLAFAFVCQPSILPIYKELRNANRRRMQNVANVSIFSMYVSYVLIAIFGYLTFYDNVKENLLMSYQKNDSLMLSVRLAFLVAVVLTFPMDLFPVRRAMMQLLFQDKPFHWGSHICITIFLILICNILVILVPNIGKIFGVIGATTIPGLIFILPGIFYIKIIPTEQEPMKSCPKILAVIFAGLGIIFMMMSIIFIFFNLVVR